MRISKMVLSGTALAALAAVAVFVTPASPASKAAAKHAAHVQKLAFTIAGRGNGDERVFPSGNIAVAPGVPVQVTITNYTRESHTFTIPGLNVNRLILPARGDGPRKTTFTFTANTSGSFAWYCVFCTHGVHGHRHSMGGTVWVIIDPSILP